MHLKTGNKAFGKPDSLFGLVGCISLGIKIPKTDKVGTIIPNEDNVLDVPLTPYFSSELGHLRIIYYPEEDSFSITTNKNFDGSQNKDPEIIKLAKAYYKELQKLPQEKIDNLEKYMKER